MKALEVTPIFKKSDGLDKENYRPLSFLPHLSKVIEWIMYIQNENFMEGSYRRKSHSTQHCLVNMLEKWENTLDKGSCICAMLMDLSKTFDTMDHDFSIAKSGALVSMKSYFTNREQRVSVNSNFSMWEEINPQGSLLGPLLFNIFLNDRFLFVENSVIMLVTIRYIVLVMT